MNKEIKDRLDKVFQNMKANMAKVDLLSMYSHEIFIDFPKNLPNNQFQKDITIINNVKANLSNTEFALLTEEQYTNFGVSKKFYRLLNNMSFAQLGDSELESNDFEQVLYRQELISLYSYLEGYFQDLQRLLFENDKTLLSNKGKEIPLNNILDAENYEQILAQVIDEKLAKSGYEKIPSIIEKWKREPYKIILKLKKAELKELDKFTIIRNIIIHNNSKVNDSLMGFLSVDDYKVGQSFILDTVVMREFRSMVFNIVFSAYLEIYMKYPAIIGIKNKKP